MSGHARRARSPRGGMIRRAVRAPAPHPADGRSEWDNDSIVMARSGDLSRQGAVGAQVRPSSAWAGRILTLLTTAAAFGAASGMLGCVAGLLRHLRALPLWVLAAACIFGIAAILAGCRLSMVSVRRVRDLWFVALLAAFWVGTRLAVAAAFPRYSLINDDKLMHDFVATLAREGLTHATLARLSSWYDYYLYLYRAFPLYYPLRVLFGAADLEAVHVVNAILGAGTLAFTFLIARRLVGSAYARVAAWLLAVCPYHVLDVLSYTPQIPGTFFLVVGVWLMLGGLRKRQSPWLDALWRGLALGCFLILVGIQRNGQDVLLLAIGAVVVALSALTKAGRAGLASMVATGVLAAAVWFPVKSQFDAWVRANDVSRIRSPILGYVTRGWNLVSLGEYLGRYEQLDVAAAPQSKGRLLLSALATEAARKPVIMFGVVPVVKASKFFALGFGGTAEEGLAESGYRTAALVATAFRLTYAPVVVLMCMAGFIAALNRWRLAWRLCLPTASIVLAAAAIVLFWEAQPRYSHCIHFALVTVAAVGFGSLREEGRSALWLHGGAGKRVALSAAAGLVLWFAVAGAAYGVSRQARSYLYADVSAAVVEVGGQRAPARPLDRWTGAWEQVVTLSQGTRLPATLRIGWPSAVDTKGYSGLGMSLWTPEPADGTWASCQVLAPSARGGLERYSLRELTVMKRGLWPAQTFGGGGQAVEIALLPPQGQAEFMLSQPVKLAFGYVLAEKASGGR